MARTDDFLDQNINRLMRDKSEWIESCMRQRAPKRAHSEFTDAETMIFSTLRGRELTVSDIARLRGVSRQAIHRTVSGLVERGYVRLKPAEGSRRDKVVAITATGQKLRDRAGDLLQDIEADIAKVIGKKRLETLREILSEDWSSTQE